ncbi:MAG: crotonase/enoyl-CoA hydratase family protein [Alphaproteobacteria bacterium]
MGIPDDAALAAKRALQRTEALERLLDGAAFNELDVRIDIQDRAIWAYQKHTQRPSFTLPLLRDVRKFQETVKDCLSGIPDGADFPIRYMVWASRADGVFNLGGDLELFADLIRRKDREGLRAYAHACIDICYPNAINLGLPIISVALVQGDCLGGGFESALSSDVLIAERSAKFGLPEILFGLFPGMGAYSFLARRIGSVKAEEMIFSGKIFSAEELHALGVVDVLAEDGFGEEAVQEYIGRTRSKHTAHRAIYKVRRRFNPVSYDELTDITDIWVDSALQLEETDLKKMKRLASAQDRRRAQMGG